MKYLIAVDSSDNSRYAFSQAKKRFFTTKDHVYILTVTESPTAYPFEDLLNFSSESYTEMNRKIEQMYAELLKKFGRKLTRASIPHTCLLARGTIKDVICRQAQDLCVDVVIMGRRGLGTLERTFMGSTSQYCVHNLNCSVLVIPFIQEENLTTKTEEELASELKSKEREEISGNIKCFDPNCHNEECLQHGSKFQKIGQYEREKWQAPEERLSEPKQQNVPIKSEGKKSKKNKNNKGNVGKSVGKWEDVTKESKEKGIEKEEFAQVDPAIIEKEKEKRKGKITGELLKEQKTKLKHEEGTIEVTEEETEIEYLPKEELEKEKAKRKGKITGELLKQQKTKLKHEEGTIDVIEEDKEGKEFSKSKEVSSKKNISKESGGKWVEKGKGKEETKVEAKEGAGKKEAVFQEVTSKKKKNRKRRNRNKGKSPEEKGKVEEKKFENLPECLPKEAFPHFVAAKPITGELLSQQKKKLKHEKGTIDVTGEEKKEFLKSKESGGKVQAKGKGKGKGKEEFSESKEEFKKESGVKETPKESLPTAPSKNKKRNRNNKNKGKANVKETNVKGSNVKDAKDLPECLPKEAFPHFESAKPITGDLLSQQKKKLKHEKGTIDVTGEEKKEFLKSKESGGKVQGKGKGKGKGKEKEEFSEVKLKEESEIEYLPKEELEKEKAKRKGKITGELLKKQKTKLIHEEGTIDVTGEEKKEFLSKSKESGGKGKEEFKEETSSPITGKWKGKDISGSKPTSVSGSESPKIISKFESPKRSKLEEKECNDPLCNNPECAKHGTQVKEEVKKGPKWQGKVHEKKECNDPLCNNPHCVKHGKASKEKGEFIGSKGKESSSPSSASKEVPYSGKSFAEVVSQSSEEKSQSPKIIEKSEHKAAINIGEGKIEGKIGSKTDEEGAWKGSVEVGYKGKDEKGKEYEGKHYEASIQSK